MKGNRLINFALAAVTLLWGIPHAFRPAAAQGRIFGSSPSGRRGCASIQIDPRLARDSVKVEGGGSALPLSATTRATYGSLVARAGFPKRIKHPPRRPSWNSTKREISFRVGEAKAAGVSMAIERTWTLRG